MQIKDSHVFVKSYTEPLTKEQEYSLFEELQTTEDPIIKKKLTEKIVSHYSPIIRRAVKDLSSYKMEKEELLSEGVTALLEAAKRFDLERGFRFSTYAKWWVKGMMYSHITKNYFMVHVCTSHNRKNLFFGLRKIIAIALKNHGSFRLTGALANELAEEYSTTTTEIQMMYDMIKKPYDMFSEPIGNFDRSDGEKITKGDTIGDKNPQSEDIVIDYSVKTFQRKLITDAMEKVLTDREKRIFEQKLLLNKPEQPTLEALGKEFSISKERVRQLRNHARSKIEKEIVQVVNVMGIDPTDFYII